MYKCNGNSGPAPAISDWDGHCVCVSVNKVGGSGGMPPQENFFKFSTLRSLLRLCLGQKKLLESVVSVGREAIELNCQK